MSFYKRDFSAEHTERRHVSLIAAIKSCKVNKEGKETHQLFIAEGGGSHGRGDSSLTGVLH